MLLRPQTGNAGKHRRSFKASAAALLVPWLALSQPMAAFAQISNTVTVNGSFGGSPVVSTDTEDVDVANATATLTITKSGVLNDDDGIAGQSAGDTISWTINVRNDGNVSIETITVSDTLGTPVCATSGDETIATLAPGADEDCTLSYTLTQADFDTNGGGDGDIDNSATANGTALGGIGPVTDTASAEVAIAPSSSISLLKTADDDTLVAAGQVITYTFVITNTGNQTLTNVSLGDVHNGTGSAPVPDADGGSITTDAGAAGDSTNSTTGDNVWDVLAPGDVLTVTATYTVTQEDVDTLQ